MTQEERVARRLIDPDLVVVPAKEISNVFDCPFRDGRCTLAFDRNFSVRGAGPAGEGRDRVVVNKDGEAIGLWLRCPESDDIKPNMGGEIPPPRRCPLRVGSIEVRAKE